MKDLHSIHTELGFTIQSSVAAVTADNADSMVLVPHDFVKSLVKSLPNGSTNSFFKELGKMAREMGSTYNDALYDDLTYEEKFAKLESMLDTRRLIDLFTEREEEEERGRMMQKQCDEQKTGDEFMEKELDS